MLIDGMRNLVAGHWRAAVDLTSRAADVANRIGDLPEWDECQGTLGSEPVWQAYKGLRAMGRYVEPGPCGRGSGGPVTRLKEPLQRSQALEARQQSIYC